MVDYSESFDKADGALGPDLTWTDVTSGWDVVSNQANVTSIVCYARAEHDTSGSDQYAEAVVNALDGDTSTQFGPCVRFQPAANSSYMFMAEAVTSSSWRARIRKTINGSRTDLSSNVTLPTPPFTLRTEVEGNEIRGYVNDVLEVTTTDTDLTTGTRGGMYGTRTGAETVTVDDFAFGDLSTGTNLAPNDASHAQTADTPSLTQTHELGTNSATHTQTADTPALTQVHELSPLSATHAQTADTPALTSDAILTPNSTSHAQTADTPFLTQVHELVPSSATHTQTVDRPALTGATGPALALPADTVTMYPSRDTVTMIPSTDLDTNIPSLIVQTEIPSVDVTTVLQGS